MDDLFYVVTLVGHRSDLYFSSATCFSLFFFSREGNIRNCSATNVEWYWNIYIYISIYIYIYIMCQFYYLSRIASQQDKGDEEDFSALDEPLPECTLAFTHGIGKQVTQKNKWLLSTFSFSELTLFLFVGWSWARRRAAFWDTSDLNTGLRLWLVTVSFSLISN